jgi:hypothetical protein
MKQRAARILMTCLMVALAALPAFSARAGGGAADPNGRNSKKQPKPKTDPFVEKTAKVRHFYEGENIGDSYGWLGARLGDLNGDGINEYLVTAPWADGSQGKVYLYNGSNGKLLYVHAADSVQVLGYSAVDAGDVNQDGVSDYIVGGPAGDGRAVVFSGADQSVLWDWTGIPMTSFGASVSGAGDLNGDDHADLLVGSTRFNGTGKVDAFSGLDGSLLWTHNGNESGARLGSALGPVGDVNMDGVPDVVAGADSGGPSGTGQAYVLSGVDGSTLLTLEPTGVSGGTFAQFFARAAGDLNHDGYPDVFIGDYAAENGNGKAYVYSGMDGSILLEFNGQNGEGLGPGRVMEDLNGDGYNDLIIAGWTYGPNAEGRVYLFSGKDGSILRTITGTIPNDNLGVDALSLGDLTEDGRPELLLTAVGNDFSGTDVGRAYIVSIAPFKPDK